MAITLADPLIPDSQLESGFGLGTWSVEPMRNVISRDGDERRLENRLMRTLVFMCSHPGQVLSREQFFTHVWQGRVVNEEALSRAISLLRTALEDNAQRPTYIQTIPGVGYRLIAPVAPAQQPGSGADPAPVTPAGKAVAVLPFLNLSDDPDNEYFSDGISEEILNCLAQVDGFKVVGRTSSFAFKNRNDDLRKIGRVLGASHVLEGSVRKAGQRVRITAQLIETAQGYHLWSKNFDVDLGDIFAVQDQIAAAVVDALKLHILDHGETSRATSVSAYALYLRAIHALRSGELERIKAALQLLREVTGMDPDYAPAWVGLADAYWYLISYGELARADHMGLAIAASDRALALDDQWADAHLCRAKMAMQFNRDWHTAQAAIDRAREIAPDNPQILLQAGYLASSIGRFDESVSLLEQAITLDPLNTTGHIWLSLSLISLARLDEARGVLQQALEIQPQRVVANMILGKILIEQGDPLAAHEQMQREPAGFWRDYGLALALCAMGDRVAAEAALEGLIDRYGDEAPFQIAEIYAFSGDTDRAFQWLDRAVQYSDNGLSALLGSPQLYPLRGDARWDKFVTAMRYPRQGVTGT